MLFSLLWSFPLSVAGGEEPGFRRWVQAGPVEDSMKKNTFKYIVVVALYVCTCALAVIGLILAYAAPGGGPGPHTFLGIHRQRWMDFHLSLAAVLVLLLAFHVGLGWSWIVQTTRRHFGELWLRFLWFVGFGWVIVLFAGWFYFLVSR